MLCALFVTQSVCANEPWRLDLASQVEEGINLRLDLYEESIDVPGMEMFGPMNGYMNGRGIYGVWMVTSFNINDEATATLRLSNDQGSETQSVRLTQQTDSTYLMELQGGVVVKRAVNRKLVKIPSKILLKRIP
jgi:hypothetical protein